MSRWTIRDVQSSRTIVLSSYSTRATRTVVEVDQKGKGRQVDGANSNNGAPDANMLAIEQLASRREAADTANQGDTDEAEDCQMVKVV